MDILRFGNKPLYVLDIPVIGNRTFTVFFTKIPFGMYRRIRHAYKFVSTSETELEDQIFRDYTLPEGKYTLENIENLPAGVVSVVSKLIMELSDSKTIPDDKTGEVEIDAFSTRMEGQRVVCRVSLELQMYTTICAVFKGYTFEDLEKLPFDKIHQLFACAESHLLNIGALREPLSFHRVEPPPEQGVTKEEPVPEPPRPTVKTVKSDEDAFMQMAKDHSKVKTKPAPPASEGLEVTIPQKPVGTVKPTTSIIQELEDHLNLVTPAKVSDRNPEKIRLEELEAKRVAIINAARTSGQPQRRGYTEPKDKVAMANKVTVPLTGIQWAAGMNEADFKAPEMSDAEALAAAEELDLLPAGYEIIERRNRALLAQQQRPEVDVKPTKHLTLRQLKQLKDKPK